MKEKEFLARFAPKFRGRKAGRSLHALLVSPPAEEDTGGALRWLEHLGEWVLDGPTPHSVNGSVEGESAATARLRMLVLALREVAPWRLALARACAQLTAVTNGVRLLCRTGLPSEQAFWSEAADRISRKLLPSPPDQKDASALLAHVVHSEGDASLLAALSPELLGELTTLLATEVPEVWRPTRGWLEDAAVLLCAQVSALGTSEPVRQRGPTVAPRHSPFIRLPRVFERLAELTGSGSSPASETDLAGLRRTCQDTLSECRLSLRSVLEHLESSGVSVNLVYRLELASLLLDRLEALVELMLPGAAVEKQRAVLALVSTLARDGRKHQSLIALVQTNVRLLARKIIERSGETGEHYITATFGEQMKMLASAAGGGVLTAGTCFIKYLLAATKLPLFVAGLFASLNYAGSFLLMQLLGFTLATKQPSMTAAALAGAMGRAGPKRLDETVDLITRITRSQLAAAVGNVGAIIPAAMGVDFLFQLAAGHSFLDARTAQYVIASLHPGKSGTVFFAAFTGVLLWMSSVAAGWLDNFAVYRRLPEAIAHHRLLRRLFGAKFARWLSGAFARNVAGFGGNTSLGVLLGMTPTFSAFFGLPLDSRHVTLSTGALVLAVCADPSVLGSADLNGAMVGIVVIAALNFAVSFALALFVALRARDVSASDVFALVRRLLVRGLTAPHTFVIALGAKPAPQALPAPGPEG